MSAEAKREFAAKLRRMAEIGEIKPKNGKPLPENDDDLFDVVFVGRDQHE